MLVSPTQLVHKKRHCNGFPTAHFAKNHQLLGICSVIPINKVGICQQKLASLVSSQILQIRVVLTLPNYLATTQPPRNWELMSMYPLELGLA